MLKLSVEPRRGSFNIYHHFLFIFDRFAVVCLSGQFNKNEYHSCPKEIEFILNTVNLIDALNLLKPNKLNPLTLFSLAREGGIKGG
jgi:hypothetical protein